MINETKYGPVNGEVRGAGIARSAVLEPWFPILMYHRIVDRVVVPDPYHLFLSVSDFEAQMRYLWRHGYQTTPFEDMVPGPGRLKQRHGRRFAITFDDGYREVITHALPVLRKYGFTATVFLVSSNLGGVNDWDKGRAQIVPLLDLSAVRELAASGISFGAHGVTHRSLPYLALAQARQEITGAKYQLEDATGSAINLFSYPYGASTERVQDLVMQAGYVAAFGIEQKTHTRFNLSRVDAGRCSGADLRWRLHVRGLYFHARRNTFLGALKRLITPFPGVGEPAEFSSDGLPSDDSGAVLTKYKPVREPPKQRSPDFHLSRERLEEP